MTGRAAVLTSRGVSAAVNLFGFPLYPAGGIANAEGLYTFDHTLLT
jgi:hypothetical protein